MKKMTKILLQGAAVLGGGALTVFGHPIPGTLIVASFAFAAGMTAAGRTRDWAPPVTEFDREFP